MQEFDEVRLPDDVSYGVIGGPQYSTDIVSTTNGNEYRNIKYSLSRMRYNLSYMIKTRKQIEKLIAFFRARRGRAIGFRFKDLCDYEVYKELIGIGDDVTKSFQLKKVYKSGEANYERIINKPVVGSVIIYFDDNEVQDNDIDIDHESGKIKFNFPVPSGTAVFATFQFDVPVRFDIDYLPISIDGDEMYSTKDIKLVEINL